MDDELDDEEKELLKLFEDKKLKRSSNVQKEIRDAKKSAISHLKKSNRINIRISQFDLERIKRSAAVEGLPYQTLISSILHKYANRPFLDK